MCFSCCSMQYYQSFMRNQKEKIELQKKVHRRICVRNITFLAARPSLYVIFFRFFSLLPAFRLFQFFCRKNVFTPEDVVGGAGVANVPPGSVVDVSQQNVYIKRENSSCEKLYSVWCVYLNNSCISLNLYLL